MYPVCKHLLICMPIMHDLRGFYYYVSPARNGGPIPRLPVFFFFFFFFYIYIDFGALCTKDDSKE